VCTHLMSIGHERDLSGKVSLCLGSPIRCGLRPCARAAACSIAAAIVSLMAKPTPRNNAPCTSNGRMVLATPIPITTGSPFTPISIGEPESPAHPGHEWEKIRGSNRSRILQLRWSRAEPKSITATGVSRTRSCSSKLCETTPARSRPAGPFSAERVMRTSQSFPSAAFRVSGSQYSAILTGGPWAPEIRQSFLMRAMSSGRP
jgi:hypothetical protein